MTTFWPIVDRKKSSALPIGSPVPAFGIEEISMTNGRAVLGRPRLILSFNLANADALRERARSRELRIESPAGDVRIVIERDPPALALGALEKLPLRLHRAERIDVVGLIPRRPEMGARGRDVAEMDEGSARVLDDRALMEHGVPAGDDDAEPRGDRSLAVE